MNISEELSDSSNSPRRPGSQAARQPVNYQTQSHSQATTTTPFPPQEKKPFRFFRPEKIGPAFWTITSLLSLFVNAVLITIMITLLSFSNSLFEVKQHINNQLIAGLYGNFVLMDEARITTTIPVNTEVPAKFDLPLDTDTTVTLSEDTSIPNATVRLKTGGLTIANAPADIVLPAGTELPIHLSLIVPVDQKIPVNLNVNVDIPLKETDLHVPFVGLQNVIAPYYDLLRNIPNSWEEILCKKHPGNLCRKLVP